MPIEVENGRVALEDLTPEEYVRLMAAVRIVIDWLLERAPLKDDEDPTRAEEDTEPSVEPQTVQLPLES